MFDPELLRYIGRHCRRNRTTVSRDILPMLEDAAALAGLPLRLHRFPSGADIATWIVPERWDVREAWLRGPDGRIVASYDDHPLFVAPYSMPFRGELTLAELRPHIRSHETQRDAFYYEHRLAYDFRRRLKEWIITLPAEKAAALPEGRYEVNLDFDIGPGEMLVGELTLPGETADTVALLADYCHPGQVNDSLTGIVTLVDVMRRLASLPKRRFTYTLYLFAETIGSCVLLGAKPEIAARTKLAIFCECVGWGDRWVLSVSDRPGSTADLVARDAAHSWPKTETGDLASGWGNDEHVFDYAGVPSLAVQKYDFPEYHSSNDSPERVDPSSLAMASDMVFGMCRALEDDCVYERTQIVPIYLTRFGLYRDAVEERGAFQAQRRVLNAIDGKQSLLEIAASTGVPFRDVKTVAERIAGLGLLKRSAERRF